MYTNYYETAIKRNGRVQEDISIIDKERILYNIEHNKLLSYGQYVGMKILEKEKAKRLK